MIVIGKCHNVKHRDLKELIVYFPSEDEKERMHSLKLAIKLLDSHVVFPLSVKYGNEIYNNPKNLE